MLASPALFYHHFSSMGTRFDLIIPGPDRDHVLVGKKIEKIVGHWHHKLNRFDPESDLSLINRFASRSPYPIDEEMFEVLSLCGRYVDQTFSTFDPALLRLQKAWEENGFTKTPRHRKILHEGSGWHHVHLDQANLTVTYDSSLTAIDLGGFAKGFALQKIRDILGEEGIGNALVSFGESTILALGHHPEGDHWPIGIMNVFGPENLCTFPLQDSTLSVSGITKKHMPDQKTGYIHILSPQSGYPIRGYRLEAVECPNPLDAEILSTALMAAGKSQREKLIQRFSPLRHATIHWAEKEPHIKFTELKEKV